MRLSWALTTISQRRVAPSAAGSSAKGSLLDLVVSREKRIIIEISGAESPTRDPSKVALHCSRQVRWIKVTNETVVSRGGQGYLPGSRAFGRFVPQGEAVGHRLFPEPFSLFEPE